ncbi:efflux RND transporter periplasmic adaptor subunit [Rhizobiaceae bacterium CRRU44]|uniref:Efflux RND transporter periplasmic adaptor subunit n=1 Tax=Ferranicluibacter rubi TaxID=2715133 RepID=A0AA44CE55_9HYPH|nr:efflux RND transporter periplasmic adaptor subunit [Ferranicluibacter rubi]
MRTAARVPALLTALLLAAAPVLTRDALAQDATPAKTETQAAPDTAYPSIVVTKAEIRTVIDRVIATGTIQAVEETFVQPLVEGLSIRSLTVDIGDTVKADGTMATLNDDALLLTRSENEANLARARASLAQYQAQLVEAQANAQEAVRVSARNAKLREAGSVSTALADQTEAAAAAALARVNSAEQLIAVAQSDIKVVEAQISDVDLRLARTVIKAPVAGVVSARTAKVGAIAAGSGQPLFTIIRDGAVEMRADISESDLLKLAVGQKAKLKLADSSVTLNGTIRLISPTVDADTRLGTVFISIAEPERARVGMYANADITIEEKQALALPLTAVTSGKTETVVRKVRDGVVEMARVETGIQDGRYIEILSGLKDGDEVVAKAGAYVRDGDRITPVKAAAPTDKTATN